MAGPVLNIKIFTKSTAHTLRAISVVSFPPAFFLLLIQGIATQKVNPAISILPLFFSAAFGILLLANERKCGCQSSGLNGTPIHLFFDITIGSGLLVCLILTWVLLPGGNVSDSGIMFGTYCTNFVGLNFLVHLYFVLKQIIDALRPGGLYPQTCPQCVHNPLSTAVQKAVRGAYMPLLNGDGQPNDVEGERQDSVEDAV